MAEPNSPHDSFFKRLFSDLEVAADFLRNYLEPALVARLDLATLRLEKENFVSPDLRKHFSDLLFSVRLKTGVEVFIFLLMEHKSSPDNWVAFQLLRYIVQFWEQQRAEGCEKLPLVIPIVFYHGQEPWNVSRRLSALIESAGLTEAEAYALDFEYCLRDLSPRAGQPIKGQAKLRAGLQLMRDIFTQDLGQRLPEIFRNLREMKWQDALEYARTLLSYVSGTRRKISQEELTMAVEEVFRDPGLEFDPESLFVQEFRAKGIDINRVFEPVIIAAMERRDTLLFVLERQLRRKFGEIDETSQKQILELYRPQLEELIEALLGFRSVEELRTWLQQHPPPERWPVLN